MLTFPITLFAKGITTITQQTSATSTASTITVPASVIAGDILILFDAAYSASSAPSDVTPTGWTSGQKVTLTASGVGMRGNISYKLAVNADASATVTGMNGGAANHKMMYVFRPDTPALILTLGDPQGGTGNAGAISQTTTSGSGTPPLVVVGGASANGNVGSVTFSPSDGSISPNNQAYLAYKIYNLAATPANATITVAAGVPGPKSGQILYIVPSLS